MRNAVVVVTFGFLGLGLLAAIGWFISSPEFEPLITTLALLATVTALVVERLVSVRERRHELLYSLVHELFLNRNILIDPRFNLDNPPDGEPRVYPRLHVSTLETAIASGAFTASRDRKLFKWMHRWKQRAGEFNRRLDLSELRTFMNPSAEEIEAFHNEMTTGIVLSDTRSALAELWTILLEDYSKESEVASETVLFDAD